MQELIDAYYKLYPNKKDSFRGLNDLVEMAKNKDFVDNLQYNIREECITYQICPVCMSDLKVKYDKNKSEAWGMPVVEEYGTAYFCEVCGWEEE